MDYNLTLFKGSVEEILQPPQQTQQPAQPQQAQPSNEKSLNGTASKQEENKWNNLFLIINFKISAKLYYVNFYIFSFFVWKVIINEES